MSQRVGDFTELGFYALAGEPDSSRDLIDEVRAGEALGLGTVFVSERYNKKEIAAQCGAAAAGFRRHANQLISSSW